MFLSLEGLLRFVFSIDFVYFRVVSSSQQSREEGTMFPYALTPFVAQHTQDQHTPPPPSGPFVATDEPKSVHHYHLKTIVHIKVHSWWLYILWVCANG